MSADGRPEVGEPVEDATSASQSADDSGFANGQVRRNMFACVLLDSTYAMGQTDLNPMLVPLCVFLAASNFMIGFITGGLSFLALIGIFLSPWITRKFPFKKWYFFWVNVPTFAAWGVMGLILLLRESLNLSNPQLLCALVILMAVQYVVGGFCGVPSQEYIAACIPASHRGRLMGYSFTIGSIGGLGAAEAARRILLAVHKPECFGYIFLLGWFISQAGFLSALFAKERPTPVEKSPRPWSKHMLRAAWDDKPFIAFLVLMFCWGTFINPVFSFVSVFGFKGLGMALAAAAVFQIIGKVVTISSSSLAGHVTDKLTPRRILPYWFLLATVSLLPVVFFQHPYAVYASVALCTLYGIGLQVTANAMMYAIPSPENRAGHFTIYMVVLFTLLSLGPMLFGKLCDVMPYRTVFTIVAFLALAFFAISKYVLKKVLPEAREAY